MLEILSFEACFGHLRMDLRAIVTATNTECLTFCQHALNTLHIVTNLTIKIELYEGDLLLAPFSCDEIETHRG